jgi:hypothetical protein
VGKKIVINLFNHAAHSQQTLLDTLNPYRAALLDLGFDVVFDNSYFGIDMIVFVECFNNADSNKIERCSNFGIVATELLQSHGFNNDHSFDSRYSYFTRIVPKAKFIIANTLGLGDYSRFGKACVVELGWHQSLAMPDHDDKAVNDFCFYGTPSPAREHLINSMIGHGLKVVMLRGFAEFGVRNQIVQSSKWVLGLKPMWKDVKYVSITRITSAMFCKRPVAYESYVRYGGISDIPLVQDQANLVEWLIKIKENWKVERDRQLSKFMESNVTDNMRKGLLEIGLL